MSNTNQNDKDKVVRSGRQDELVTKTYRRETGRFEVKEVDTENRTFRADVGAMGNLDRGDDVVHPGSFTKTIREKVPQGKVKLLDHHNKESMQDLLGRVMEAEEVPAEDEFGENAPSHFLRALHKVSRRPEVESMLMDIEDNIADAMSIGFKPLQVEFELKDGVDEDLDPEMAWFHGMGIRHIKEVEWWESSLVIWGMNPEASPLPGTVKSFFDKLEKMDEAHLDEASEKDVMYLMKSLRDTLREAEVDASILQRDEFSNVAHRLGDLIEDVEKQTRMDTIHTSALADVFDEFKDRKDDVETSHELVAWFGDAVAELEGVDVKTVDCAQCGEDTNQIVAGELEDNKFVCPNCMTSEEKEDTQEEPENSNVEDGDTEMININNKEISAATLSAYISAVGGVDVEKNGHVGRFLSAQVEDVDTFVKEVTEDSDLEPEDVKADLDGNNPAPSENRLETYADVLDVEKETLVEITETFGQEPDEEDDVVTQLKESGIDLSEGENIRALHDYISSRKQELEDDAGDGESQDAGDTKSDEPGSDEEHDSKDGDSDEHLDDDDHVDLDEKDQDELRELKSELEDMEIPDID